MSWIAHRSAAQTQGPWAAITLSLTCCLVLAGNSWPGARLLAPVGAQAKSDARLGLVVTADALTVASQDPRVALATLRDSSRVVDRAGWAFRSADGGKSWMPLTFPDDLVEPGAAPVRYDWSAPLADVDGSHLYLNNQFRSSPDNSDQGVSTSDDGGASWSARDNPQDSDTIGHQVLAVNPLVSGEAYAEDSTYAGGADQLQRSVDFGAHWQDMASMDALTPKGVDPATVHVSSLIPDATVRGRLYATVDDMQGAPRLDTWSVDDGSSWHQVQLPTGLNVANLQIGTDPHLPGQLLLYPVWGSGPATPYIYGTMDGGSTWRHVACPGVLDGTCPKAVITNTLGDRQSFGLYADGFHAFTGAGPAGQRLAVSGNLPLPPQDIRALAAGSHVGDPIFLLGSTIATEPGLVYESTDGARHWTEAFAGTLPTLASAGHAPGAVYVAQTHHEVAPAFGPMYRSLGLQQIGYPIDEAYTRNGDLVQDFERLELVKSHATGKVIVATLGQEVCSHLCPSVATAPVSAQGGAMYFAQSRHTLDGAFSTYWQKHSGLQVFGPPISQAIAAQNGDGSGRTYRIQYFANARLELHPESHNTVQVGLLGDEALRERGWA